MPCSAEVLLLIPSMWILGIQWGHDVHVTESVLCGTSGWNNNVVMIFGCQWPELHGSLSDMFQLHWHSFRWAMIFRMYIETTVGSPPRPRCVLEKEDFFSDNSTWWCNPLERLFCNNIMQYYFGILSQVGFRFFFNFYKFLSYNHSLVFIYLKSTVVLVLFNIYLILIFCLFLDVFIDRSICLFWFVFRRSMYIS